MWGRVLIGSPHPALSYVRAALGDEGGQLYSHSHFVTAALRQRHRHHLADQGPERLTAVAARPCRPSPAPRSVAPQAAESARAPLSV